MREYIDLEVNYKKSLLNLLESIEKITIKDNDGSSRVAYIKESINDKVTS